MRAFKHQCSRCEKGFDSEDSLRKHVGRKHRVRSEDFYVELKLGGVAPLCGCGCGKATRYWDWSQGFSRFAPGHQSRVQNPMQGRRHSDASRAKMSTSSMGIPSWSRGLSKDSEPRLQALGRKVADSWTQEKRDEYSERMRRMRLDGTVPTLRGADHSQWKGGTSSIRARVDAQQRMWVEWKEPVKQRAGYRCEDCGVASHSLDVHHDGERMADIVRRFVDEMNPDRRELSWEEGHRIVEAVIDYHVRAPVSGRALCRECHEALHASMNF